MLIIGYSWWCILSDAGSYAGWRLHIRHEHQQGSQLADAAGVCKVHGAQSLSPPRSFQFFHASPHATESRLQFRRLLCVAHDSFWRGRVTAARPEGRLCTPCGVEQHHPPQTVLDRQGLPREESVWIPSSRTVRVCHGHSNSKPWCVTELCPSSVFVFVCLSQLLHCFMWNALFPFFFIMTWWLVCVHLVFQLIASLIASSISMNSNTCLKLSLLCFWLEIMNCFSFTSLYTYKSFNLAAINYTCNIG